MSSRGRQGHERHNHEEHRFEVHVGQGRHCREEHQGCEGIVERNVEPVRGAILRNIILALQEIPLPHKLLFTTTIQHNPPISLLSDDARLEKETLAENHKC